MSKNDGGPAFPAFEAPVVGAYPLPIGGMSLRDWFAGQALTAILQYAYDDRPHHERGASLQDWAAQGAYIVADAMLKARSE